MRRTFSTTPGLVQTSIALLIMRLGIGALMLTHGWPKLMRLIEGGEIVFRDPLGIGVVTSLIFATLAEFFGSILIMLGVATRMASLALIFTMAVAVFIVHADDPFTRKELGLLYMLVYIILLIMGSGKYSLDRLVRN